MRNNWRLKIDDCKLKKEKYEMKQMAKTKWLRVLTLGLAVLVSVPAFAQKPDRSKPPELGPAPSLKLPALQRFKL